MLYEKISLLISYIKNDTKFDKVENINVDYLITLCKYHSLLPLLYKACKKFNIYLNEKQNCILEKAYLNAVYQEATQEVEKKIILEKLNNEQIKCMPLKGSILKYLYPSPELRTMSDLDILFENKKTKKVKKIFESLGYKCERLGGSDDSYVKKPYMKVEMHRIMVDGNFELIANYYNNIWDVIKPISDGSYIFEMSKEDFYIHMVAHVARHYSVGGIGIRFVFDEWIYLEKYGHELNFEYINAEFKKINLLKFAENFKQLTIKWFNKIKTSDLEEQMTKYIFESGTYGSIKHEQSIKLVLGKDGMKNFQKSKIRYILRMIFPSYKYMKSRNNILKKVPILLPYFYVQRILIAIFKKKKLVIESITGLDNFNEDYSNQIKNLHDETGI